VSALVGALVMSFTIVPVLSLLSLRGNVKQKDSPVLVFARRLYEPTLGFAMKTPALVAFLAVGALVAALTLLPRLGSEFLPELNEGAVYVTCTLPGNTSITQGRELAP